MTNPTNSFSFSNAQVQAAWDQLQVQPSQWVTSPVGVAGASINPQSVPQPPAPDPSGWTPQAGSYYFDFPAYAQHFEARRAMMISSYGGVWSETKEIQLVKNLWADWYGEPWPGPGYQNWKYPELDLDKLETIPLRPKELKPFKIDYETYQEIKLRLMGTVISIKGHPFRVDKISGTSGKFCLAVHDGNKLYKVEYKDIQDLRTIPPMYTSQGWLCRTPARIYQQGINRHNTKILSVDSSRGLCSFDAESFLRTFPKRADRKWEEGLSSLLHTEELSSIRLSDEMAVKADKSRVVACYKGRELGTIKDNEVFVLDEDDLLQGWIEKSAKKVGLDLRSAGT